MINSFRYTAQLFKNFSARGSLIIIGLGLIFIGGYILLNRSLGTEHFLNSTVDLKIIAIPVLILGCIIITIFSTQLRILPIIGFAIVILAMTIGSFGGGSMGSWGWIVGFVTILIVVPIAILLCIIAGLVSLVKIIDKENFTKAPIYITATIVLICYITLIALVHIGPKINPAFASLKSKDKNARIVAAQTLADIRDTRAIDPLIAMLSDTDPEIRTAAATTLGSFILAGFNSDTRAIKPLIKSLKDENAQVRAAAARSLGRITEHLNSEAAQWPVEPLSIALKDENVSVREAAAKSLSRIGNK